MPVHFATLRTQLHCVVPQTVTRLPAASAVIPMIFTLSVTKKPHNSLTRPASSEIFRRHIAAHHEPIMMETFMPRRRCQPHDISLKGLILAGLAFVTLAGSPALAADEPD